MAGCSCALALAKLLLYRSLRKIGVAHPLVQIRNVVDDVTVQACGPRALCAREAGRAVTMLLKEFKRKRLPVSLQKTVYLASSAALDAELANH